MALEIQFLAVTTKWAQIKTRTATRIVATEATAARFVTYIVCEEFELDTKGVNRIRISKKIRQHNGQKKKYKGTNNDLQNKHIKLKIE